MNTKRLDNLRKLISKNKLDAFLITNPVNLRYIFNFGEKGCLALISKEGKTWFFCSTIYLRQAPGYIGSVKTKVLGKEEFFKIVSSMKIKRLGFESEDVTVFRFGELKKKLKGVNLVGQKDLVEKLRTIKDKEELQLIKKAARIADETYKYLLTKIRSGVKEIDLANKIDGFMKLKGAKGISFDPVVAGGTNSAFPHYVAGSRRLARGEAIILDFGCIYKAYCSDLTRTVLKGDVRDRYKTVLRAQEEAIKIIKPGVKCSEVDRVARDVITKAGLGHYFIHGTGHGIGLEVHEMPYLTRSSRDVLKENMVVTVEPGIYIPGWGGVRIEDMILVTRRGHEILTKAKK